MTLSDHIPLSVNAQTNLFLFQETPQQLYSDRDVLVSLPLLRKLSVGYSGISELLDEWCSLNAN